MAKPVTEGNSSKSKDGCIPISSNCVVWKGPDIPCINLCAGDTITDVVYKLALKLCEIADGVVDISALDLGCIIDGSEPLPENLQELLQEIINKICEIPEPTPPGEPASLPLVPLAECLRYTNEEGDLVTFLRLDLYVQLIAEKLCDVLEDIHSLSVFINNINERVTHLEFIINNLNPGGGVTTLIPTACLSNSGTLGQLLPIDLAFINLEARLCEYIALVGNTGDWMYSLNNICINANTALPCGEGTYGLLPGWITNPSTAAASVNNLWLAMCAMHTCVEGSLNPQTICNPIPVTNLEISDLTNVSSTLTWTAPLIPLGGTQPSGYMIYIYNSNRDCEKLDEVTSFIVTNPTSTSFNISSILIEPNSVYYVEVIALYPCGEESANVCGNLVITPLPSVFGFYEEKIDIEEEDSFCNETPYNKTTKEISVVLKDSKNNEIVNPFPVPIDFVFKLRTETCVPLEYNESTITVSILPGNSSGSVIFVHIEKILCEKECLDIKTNVICLVSWTLEDNLYYGLDPITFPGFCIDIE